MKKPSVLHEKKKEYHDLQSTESRDLRTELEDCLFGGLMGQCSQKKPDISTSEHSKSEKIQSVNIHSIAMTRVTNPL